MCSPMRNTSTPRAHVGAKLSSQSYLPATGPGRNFCVFIMITGVAIAQNSSTPVPSPRQSSPSQSPLAVSPPTTKSGVLGLASSADFNCDATGSGDAANCLNAAIGAFANGGTLLLGAGTYKLASSTVSLLANVCLVGAGAGATTLTATGSFPAITILNAMNTCVMNLTVRSVNEAISLQTTNTESPTQSPFIQNVNITSYGAASAAIHVASPVCCVYWAQFSNINITNGGLPEDRTGYLFDGHSGYNMRPMIYAGRVADARYGMNVVSAENLIVEGTEFDDIIASGNGIAIWLHSGVQDSRIAPRLEAWGAKAPIDKDWQFDPGSHFNNMFLAGGYSGPPPRGTDGGTANCVFGGNGSGGLINYCLNPQIVGNLTLASGSLLSLPGSANQEFNLGGALSAAQLSGGKSLATVRMPATDFGTALTIVEDGADHAAVSVESHDFNGVTRTGRACQFGASGIESCSADGGNSGAPIVLGSAVTGTEAGVQIPAIPVERLPACTDALEGTHKSVTNSRTAVFNDALLGGGAQHVDAYCAGTTNGWRVH